MIYITLLRPLPSTGCEPGRYSRIGMRRALAHSVSDLLLGANGLCCDTSATSRTSEKVVAEFVTTRARINSSTRSRTRNRLRAASGCAFALAHSNEFEHARSRIRKRLPNSNLTLHTIDRCHSDRARAAFARAVSRAHKVQLSFETLRPERTFRNFTNSQFANFVKFHESTKSSLPRNFGRLFSGQP